MDMGVQIQVIYIKLIIPQIIDIRLSRIVPVSHLNPIGFSYEITMGSPSSAAHWALPGGPLQLRLLQPPGQALLQRGAELGHVPALGGLGDGESRPDIL